MIKYLSLALSLLFISCGQHVIKADKTQKTEIRTISGTFSEIDIDAPVDAAIFIDSSQPMSFQFTGPSNILSCIKTEVKNGKLKIHVNEIYDLDMDKNVQAVITMPSLGRLDISGTSKVVINGTVSQNFDADISGVGSIAVREINAGSLQVDISGSGNLSIASGHVNKAELDLSGSGSIAAFGLVADHVEVDISGAGGAEVNALQSLDAEVSGAGSVHYKGQPAVTKDISGAGVVSAVQ